MENEITLPYVHAITNPNPERGGTVQYFCPIQKTNKMLIVKVHDSKAKDVAIDAKAKTVTFDVTYMSACKDVKTQSFGGNPPGSLLNVQTLNFMPPFVATVKKA